MDKLVKKKKRGRIYIYIYIMEYYSAMREKDILPFVTIWMEIEGVMLSEINQTKKNTYCMISLTCII